MAAYLDIADRMYMWSKRSTRAERGRVRARRRSNKMLMRGSCVFFFFFQAEDGIRDLTVTGVQTCALPICGLVDAEPLAHPPEAEVLLVIEAPQNLLDRLAELILLRDHGGRLDDSGVAPKDRKSVV